MKPAMPATPEARDHEDLGRHQEVAGDEERNDGDGRIGHALRVLTNDGVSRPPGDDLDGGATVDELAFGNRIDALSVDTNFARRA